MEISPCSPKSTESSLMEMTSEQVVETMEEREGCLGLEGICYFEQSDCGFLTQSATFLLVKWEG